LNTQEVSLVDSPANEVEFLVVKNHQEKTRMGANAVVKKRVSMPVDDADGDEDAVSKALGHVSGIVDRIASIVTKKSEDDSDESEEPGDEESEEESSDDGDSDDADGEESSDDGDESEADVEKGASLKSVLRKCGLEGPAMKTALIKLKAAGIDPNSAFASGEKKAKPKPKFPPEGLKKPDPKAKGGKGTKGGKGAAKADDDEGDEEKTSKASEDEPLTMASLAEAVQKAAAFTPARITQLKNAQEILKLVLESVAPGEVPHNKAPVLGKHGNKSHLGVKKSSDDSEPLTQIAKALQDVSETIESMNERIEAIEKARPGSNSVDVEGTTETKTKKSASLWNGVL
jgi:hypothetical protein